MHEKTRIRMFTEESEVNTAVGVMQLKDGLVLNLSELNLPDTPEELMLLVPNLDIQDWGHDPEALKKAQEQEVTTSDKQKEVTTESVNDQSQMSSEKKEATDEQVAEVIKELLASGASTNTQGMVDSGQLNQALATKGFLGVTGTRRKDIQQRMELAGN